jgi:ribosomal-protein-alanine N-acetyltransferase
MPPPPVLHTERLVLRPFRAEDASVVQQLAGAREVADTTLSIPHPYDDSMAEQWIATHQASWERGEQLHYAITLGGKGLIGAIGLTIVPAHGRAELGYWIGVPYWNRGYASEAARAIVAFGFDSLGLHRICATHFVRNPASGRVMLNAGMKQEGIHREHFMKWNRYEDVAVFGVLRAEFHDTTGSSD